MTILPELVDYDWEQAFTFAHGEWAAGSGRETDPPQPFSREDVETIFGLSAGQKDGDDWIILGRLKSGLFFFLTAGCDYTGWDCQSGGRAYIAGDMRPIVSLVLTHHDKARLEGTINKLREQGYIE